MRVAEPAAAPAAASPVIRLNPADDVAIARVQLVAGMRLKESGVTVAGLVPPGHKVALRAIAAGQAVRRYDNPIGIATCDIAAGSHVHTHNLAITDFERDYAFAAGAKPTAYFPQPATFLGIVRPDGRVATRNFIGLMTSVNCSATVVRAIADHFRRDIRPEALADFPNVDGVLALAHGLGCGQSAASEGMRILRRTMAGYARHANFAAVGFVGLGCEQNQIAGLEEAEGLAEGDRLRSFTIQDAGGTAKAVARGIAMVKEWLPEANRVSRRPVPASHLVVGLQCGGSDGYSGVSANPALGAAVDLLVRHGGTAVLSETPEIFGAEHLLTRRAVSREVGEKLLARIDWWKEHCARHGTQMNNNPTPGNKAGGITTVLEKSLGGVTKGGTTNLVDVVEYAQPVAAKGLVFMDTTGYDPVSATGQVAGGANLIAFTTGRGSAYGCAPSPSLKLGTNTALWNRQSEDIDVNCGEILDGACTIDAMGERFFRMLLDCASGTRSKSELHGYGQAEFVPWQLGLIV